MEQTDDIVSGLLARVSEQQSVDLAPRLLSHVKREWNAARIAKEGDAEKRLFQAARQRSGEYDPDKLQAIREIGGSEIYMMLTQVKCRATESWISEILFPPGERPYGVEPTPIPDLPPQVKAQTEQQIMGELMELTEIGLYPTREAVHQRLQSMQSELLQHAQSRAEELAERMEDFIADVFEEGGWQSEFEQLISDFVTYPTAFFKGPIRIQQQRMNWAQDQYGEMHPAVGKEAVRTFKRVSPFDIYPGADSTSLSDGSLFEIVRYRRKDLYDLIGLPGYDADAIRKVIDYYGETGYEVQRSGASQRQHLDGRNHEDWAPHGVIEGLNFWGPVRGEWLLEWGLGEDKVPDPYDDYEANIVVVGDQIIRAALNPHPLNKRPYQSASFENMPGRIWGRGVPELIKDVQDMANAAARSLVNNMALASGPMADVQVDRLADGEEIGNWYPWRTIQTKESQVTGGNRPAVQFFQPVSNSKELMAVFEFFSTLADEYSGIPPYAQGVNTKGGAAGTATGLSMLMDSAARGVKRAVKSLDRGVIKPSVQRTFEDIMFYEQDSSMKGDLRVIARASSAMANRERMALRRTELAQVTSSNPMDAQIMGLEGRRRLLEDMFRSVDIDPTGIVPDADKLRGMLMQQQQLQMQQQQMAQDQMADGSPQGGPQPNEQAA